MDERKRCARCGESKHTSEFGRHKHWRDGLFPYCRECKRAADRASHAKHRSRRNAEAKARYIADPEPYKARTRQRYRDKPDEVLAYIARWQAENPEKVKQYKAKWVKDNLSGAVRENTRRRYARRKGAFAIPFTSAQLADKIAYWGGRCWLCRAPFQAVDHVKPLVVGGPHILANLRPICTSCNSRKRATWPLPKGAPMVHSPSRRFENGTLVEKNIETPVAGEPDEYEPQATKPYKVPLPTKRSAEEPDAKAVQSAENKAVAPSKATAKKARKR